ncbi:MmcQ/YjbR family DNA-binding protein [Lentilactobacillus parabuchneri]
MNKSNWLSVRLSQVPEKQICDLIDESYQITQA